MGRNAAPMAACAPEQSLDLVPAWVEYFTGAAVSEMDTLRFPILQGVRHLGAAESARLSGSFTFADVPAASSRSFAWHPCQRVERL
jgi:hypothetical protein